MPDLNPPPLLCWQSNTQQLLPPAPERLSRALLSQLQHLSLGIQVSSPSPSQGAKALAFKGPEYPFNNCWPHSQHNFGSLGRLVLRALHMSWKPKKTLLHCYFSISVDKAVNIFGESATTTPISLNEADRWYWRHDGMLFDTLSSCSEMWKISN